MATLKFEPRLTYKNQKKLPASILGLINLSAGVTAYEPIFVDATAMQAMLKNKNTSAQGQHLNIVEGLTDPSFSLSFEDFEKQWTKKDKNGVTQWQFSG